MHLFRISAIPRSDGSSLAIGSPTDPRSRAIRLAIRLDDRRPAVAGLRHPRLDLPRLEVRKLALFRGSNPPQLINDLYVICPSLNSRKP